MNDNAVWLRSYNTSGGVVYVYDLDRAQDMSFSLQYPGGMCNNMTFFVPRDVTANWPIDGHQRITAWNGNNLIWEGEVVNLASVVRGDGQGVQVTCAGYWATLLQNRKTMKPWADTRIDETAWAWVVGTSGELKCDLDRTNHLKFNPKREAWANNEVAYVRYVTPTGQTVKRITFSYDFQERAQAWTFGLWDVTNATGLWSVTATGTGTQDIALGTPSSNIYFYFNASAAQTPPDSTPATAVYGQVASVTVYTETGSINAQEIVKDIAGYVSEISTDLSKIGAETLSLVPFINDPPRTYAEAIAQAASVGDTTFNRWGFYVGMSDQFSDGKPGLVLELVPALTDYDYAVRMDDPNVTSDLSFAQDFDGIRNWIGVQYQTTSGAAVYVTPDDDAALKDTASITAYGQRELWLTLPTTSLANAKYQAGRYLAFLKSPQWIATGTIAVAGTIRGKSAPVPTSQIQPGKRVKIENWLNDLSGNGLTFLISGTDYSDADQTATITIGKPDPTEFIIARLQRQLELQQRFPTAG